MLRLLSIATCGALTLFLAHARPVVAQAAGCGDKAPGQCFLHYLDEWEVTKGCTSMVTLWQLGAQEFYILKARTGKQYSEPARPDVQRCVADFKAAMQPLYVQARDALSSNRDAVGALKDLYSSWLTYIELVPDGAAIVPAPANIAAYKREISERQKGIAERVNRLKLEL